MIIHVINNIHLHAFQPTRPTLLQSARTRLERRAAAAGLTIAAEASAASTIVTYEPPTLHHIQHDEQQRKARLFKSLLDHHLTSSASKVTSSDGQKTKKNFSMIFDVSSARPTLAKDRVRRRSRRWVMTLSRCSPESIKCNLTSQYLSCY